MGLQDVKLFTCIRFPLALLALVLVCAMTLFADTFLQEPEVLAAAPPVHFTQRTPFQTLPAFSISHPSQRTATPTRRCAPGSSLLDSTAAISATDMWAVGYCLNSNKTADQTLTEHWNGTKWTEIASPNVPPASNLLQGVAAFNSKGVWAVSYSINSTTGASQTLIEHWNGFTWSVVPSPNITVHDSELFGVTALSQNNVWAVGTAFNTSEAHVLIEHWDGRTWSITPSPNIAAARNLLVSVSGTSSTDVWAVGYAYTQNGVLAPLVHWNGRTWTLVPNPSVPSNIADLHSVKTISSKDAWAVGGYVSQAGVNLPLTEHWDGAKPAPVLHRQAPVAYSRSQRQVVQMSGRLARSVLGLEGRT